jgi:hypothetical protein
MRLAVLLALLLAAPMPAQAAGLGVQLSRSEEQGDAGQSADAYGVFLRLNLVGPLHVWVDLAKLEVEDAEGRRDRRLGAGLQLEIPGLGKWVPLLLAGVGAQEAVNDDGDATLFYSELGAGLAYRLVDQLRLEVDVRKGKLSRLEEDDETPRSIMAVDSREYFAGRVSLALDF